MADKYQIFTRASHYGGESHGGHCAFTIGRPRRVAVVATIQEARDYCTARNAKRSARQIRDGFHYEFANLAWYKEAFL